jgi:hypothetical protein
MNKLSVLMLTNSDDDYKLFMTRRTIQTLRYSCKNITVTLVDSGKKSYNWLYADLVSDYVYPALPFNYNQFLNIAFKNINFETDWILITNNDVSYDKHWFTEILKIHEKRPDITSFSPNDPLFFMKYYPMRFIGTDEDYIEAYDVTAAISGWSILIKKESADKIFPLDEQFDMYYQDNDYALTIKELGIKHAVVRNSIASHLNTLNVLEKSVTAKAKMEEDEEKFRNKWKIYK